MALLTLYIASLLLAVSTHALEESERAVEVKYLNTRAATAGGWALLTPTCPTTSQTCEGSFCCPFEMECMHNGNGNHCCPPGTSCLAAYQASPQCADDSWSLWKAKSDATHGFFCCLPGQIGTNAGTCVTANTPVVSSLSASLLSAATGTAAPASTVKSSASAATKSSSLATAATGSSVSASSTLTAASQSSATATQTSQQTVSSGAAGKNSIPFSEQLLPLAILGGAFAALV